MGIELIIFQLAVLIFSVIVHEIAHGAVAYWLGDDTAYRLGRLTLNPVSHIDPFGSIILPLLLSMPILFGQTPIIVGWAKPVPYDPRFLKNPKTGAGLIALAGPLTNICVAVVFTALVAAFQTNTQLVLAFNYVILINLMLAVFNCVPIPPLDGSKMLEALLPNRSPVIAFLERNSLILIIVFIIFGLNIIQGIVSVLYTALMALVSIT